MMENEVYDVLIAGSGPAGLGAAVYATRAGLKAAVVDRSPVSGGQVQSTYEVDNYLGLPGLGGGELSDRFREHADRAGNREGCRTAGWVYRSYGQGGFQDKDGDPCNGRVPFPARRSG